MPSTSKKQHKFMEAVAHNPSFAKRAGVPQSVGKEFSNADKGKSFKKGGDMAGKMNPGFMAMMAKKKPAMKMDKGGLTMVKKGDKLVPDFAADGVGKMKHGGMAKKKMAMGGYAGGGSASKRADGIASKGKTKGKMLAKGGMTKKYC